MNLMNLYDKAVLEVDKKEWKLSRKGPEDLLQRTFKERNTCCSGNLVKKKLLQIPFKVAAVLDQTSTVDPNDK